MGGRWGRNLKRIYAAGWFVVRGGRVGRRDGMEIGLMASAEEVWRLGMEDEAVYIVLQYLYIG